MSAGIATAFSKLFILISPPEASPNRISEWIIEVKSSHPTNGILNGVFVLLA
jgi:hypothetical protein